MKPQFIVAEISKNWPEESPGFLAERFEALIEVELQRGYRLHSFEPHRLMTAPGEMNETIIAVFEVNRADQALLQ